MALQANSLKKHGYQVHAVTHSGRPSALAVISQTEVSTPIRNWLVRNRVPKSIRVPVGYVEYGWRVARLLKRTIRPGEIVQLTHPFLLASVPALHRRGARVYYDAFEFYAVMFRQLGLVGRAFAWLCNHLEKRYVPLLDGVLCVTSRDSWLKQQLSSLNPNVLELWNLPSRHQAVDERLRAEIQQRFSGQDVVAYVGGLHAEKGLKIFVDLVRLVVDRHPTAHFLIIGKVRGKDARAWQTDEGLDGHCTYVPWTSPEAVHTYLTLASVGLLLSMPTGIHLLVGPGNGRKLFTYVAAGVPVVAPAHSPAWDFVTREQMGIQVDTTRAEDVAEGVLKLLRNRDLRKRMARQARRMFQQKYHWERQEARFINFFR